MRKFGPKLKDHLIENHRCELCQDLFKEGDFTAFIEIEPADEKQKLNKLGGRPYTYRGAEVHWECIPISLLPRE